MESLQGDQSGSNLPSNTLMQDNENGSLLKSKTKTEKFYRNTTKCILQMLTLLGNIWENKKIYP